MLLSLPSTPSLGWFVIPWGGLKGEVGLVCVHVPLPNAYVHVPCLVTAWVGLEQKSSVKSCLSLNGNASV